MSIICVKGGLVAADGMASVNDVVVSRDDVKIRACGPGPFFGKAVVGAVGTALPMALGALERIVMTSQEERCIHELIPKIPNSTGMIVTSSRLLIVYFEDQTWDELPRGRPFALGNGSVYATALMDAGRTAYDAVAGACERILGCGGGIEVRAVEEAVIFA